MTRLLVLLLAVAGVALAAPLAQAQMSTSLTLQSSVPDDPIVSGTRVTFSGMATLVTDALVILNTQGVPVYYEVESAPAWATVTIAPQNDVFPVHPHPGSPSYVAARQFTVIVDGASAGPDGEVGQIVIRAVAAPSAPMARYAAAALSVPIRFDAGEAECHDAPAEAHAALPADEEAQAEAPPLTTQSSASTPVAVPLAAIGGFAAVGTGVGLLLRHRFR